MEPVEYVRVCDAYGSGFFYIPGSETCLRFDGYVRYQLNANEEEFSKGYRFRLNVDARSDTEWGTLRGFGRIQGDGGPDSSDGNVSIDQLIIQLGGFHAGYTESAFVAPWGGLGIARFGPLHTDGGGSYAYQQRNQIGYTWAGADGWSATIALEDDDHGREPVTAEQRLARLGQAEARQADIDARQRAINLETAAIADRRATAAALLTALANEQTAIANRRTAATALQTAIDGRRISAAALQTAIDAREAAANSEETSIGALETAIGAQQTALASVDAAIDGRLNDMARQDLDTARALTVTTERGVFNAQEAVDAADEALRALPPGDPGIPAATLALAAANTALEIAMDADYAADEALLLLGGLPEIATAHTGLTTARAALTTAQTNLRNERNRRNALPPGHPDIPAADAAVIVAMATLGYEAQATDNPATPRDETIATGAYLTRDEAKDEFDTTKTAFYDHALRQADIDANQADLASARADLTARKTALTAEQAALTARLATLSETRNSLAAERALLDATRTDLSADQARLAAEQAKLAAEQANLNARLAALNADQDDIAAVQAGLDADQVALDADDAELAVKRGRTRCAYVSTSGRSRRRLCPGYHRRHRLQPGVGRPLRQGRFRRVRIRRNRHGRHSGQRARRAGFQASGRPVSTLPVRMTTLQALR